MAKVIRYSLAAVCFAASIGCLALWWRSITVSDEIFGPSIISSKQEVGFSAWQGLGRIHRTKNQALPTGTWVHSASRISESEREDKKSFVTKYGYFLAVEHGDDGLVLFFPLWYPALIFALAGVAVLRFRRQFSIRSALICVSVVAALLGIAAIL